MSPTGLNNASYAACWRVTTYEPDVAGSSAPLLVGVPENAGLPAITPVTEVVPPRDIPLPLPPTAANAPTSRASFPAAAVVLVVPVLTTTVTVEPLTEAVAIPTPVADAKGVLPFTVVVLIFEPFGIAAYDAE